MQILTEIKLTMPNEMEFWKLVKLAETAGMAHTISTERKFFSTKFTIVFTETTGDKFKQEIMEAIYNTYVK